MGILTNIFNRDGKKEVKEQAIPLSDPSISRFLDTGMKNLSGVDVNENTAMNFSAVYAAIRLLTETISTLPLHLYERTEKGGRKIVTDHPLAQLARNPNPEMTRNVFLEVLHGHIETYGKAYAEIVHNPRTGYPKALYPISPQNIRIQRNKKTNELEYLYVPTNETVPYWKMLHIVGFGFNGIDSYSPIQLARQSIGLGLAGEQFASRYFSQGTQIGGFIQLDGELGEEAFQRFRESVNEKYRGLKNSHGLIILEDGAKYEPVKLSMEDAQFLESREFSIKEIARWFGVKPHMIGDLSNATFSNIEHQGMEAVRYTFRPRVVRWEEALNSKLILPHEQDKYYFKFSMEGLLRGDVKSRYEAYRIGIQDGWLNANEVRSMEDMNPQDEEIGNAYFIPMNLMSKQFIVAGDNVPDYGNKNEETVLTTIEHTKECSCPECSGTNTQVKPNPVPKNLKEERQLESVSNRRSITQKFENLLLKQSKRIVKQETQVVKEALKELESGVKPFADAVEQKLIQTREFITNILISTFEAEAEELLPVLKKEVGRDIVKSKDISDFVTKYVEGLSIRQTNSLVGQIKKIAFENNVNEVEGLVNARLDEWEEKEANKIVSNELVRSENAITKAVYGMLGVMSIKSIATSGDTCPFCQNLDGKVISIEGAFLKKGVEFQPDGADKPMTPSGNISHPPYHQGCQCQIVAEL